MDDIYFEPHKIPKVDPEVIKRLSILKPWRSVLAIVTDWAIIVLCIVVCVRISYWFYPLAFVIIGSRFHALEAMLHEATHYRLHPSKRINEFIGELSVWPLGLSLFLYRKVRHFAHHKNIGTVKDSHVFLSYEKQTDRFDIPKPFGQLLKNCLTVAVRFPSEIWIGQLYATARLLPRFSKKLGWGWISFQLLIVLGIVIGSVVFGLKIAGMYLLFFVAPLMWVAVFSRHMRLLTEHFGIPVPQNSLPGSETRTVLVSWPVRVIFWPHNLNYHIEHHWYPSVPFYNLPELHTILQKSPQANQQMHITRGMKSLLQELTYQPAAILDHDNLLTFGQSKN